MKKSYQKRDLGSPKKPHVLDVNRTTALAFIKKAKLFLNLPRTLFECDVKQCNPRLYVGSKGAATVKRAVRGLVILGQVDKELNKLCKILKK
jgi:hypothetical protein